MTKHLQQHITHVILNKMAFDQKFHDDEPRAIVLKYENSIVVATSYAEKLVSACRMLGSLDVEGNGLIEVPLLLCKSFHDDEEAESISRCIEADQQLLSYAR